MTDSYTRWHRAANAAAAREDLAVSLEEAAKLTRESSTLTAVGGTQYLWADTGTAEDRIAAIDAWATANHVTAASHPAVGYCARVSLGTVTVWAVALPVRQDTPAGRDLEAVA